MSDEIQRALGRIESDVKSLLARTDRVDDRLTRVERKVWYASGFSAALAFLVSHFLGKS